jgi:glycyl-tRNA synthetase
MSEYEKLKTYRWKALLDLGLKEKNLKWHKHDNLVFYAKEAYDIEYNFPTGWKELEGIHARGNYDLTQHSNYSGQQLTYFDQATNQKFLPHIIESSIGVGRLVLAVICDAYHKEEVKGEERIVLKLKKQLAPIKVAILPLSKKEDLSVGVREVFDILTDSFRCEYDDTQSIGKRYRRQDEIGTPYCVTYDFESINDKSVTVRDRDTMSQVRVNILELKEYLRKQLEL